MVTLSPNRHPVPPLVETPGGTTLRLNRMRDGALVALLARADVLTIVAPGCAQPSSAMQAFARRLERVHEEGPSAMTIPAPFYDELGDIELDFSHERRVLGRDSARTVLAGSVKQVTDGGSPRTVAVVAFVPKHLAVCDITVALP